MITIKKKLKQKNLIFFLFLAPSLVGFLMFYLVPFVISICYSFFDSPVNGSFVGLKNYTSLLSNGIFQKAGLNTLIFTAICVPLNILFSLLLAMLLNRAIYFRNIFRTFFIIPLVIPVASVVLVWQVLFDYNGTINALLYEWGFTSINWMNSSWARVVVIVMYLWKNIGYNMVLFLAGLQSIPVEYYESAEIDGASQIKKFIKITIVYLTPTTFFVFIMSIINSFKAFRETYIISGSYPHESIYMLQHYMNNMFTSLDYQKLTSAACIMAVVIFSLVYIMFNIERRISKSIS